MLISSIVIESAFYGCTCADHCGNNDVIFQLAKGCGTGDSKMKIAVVES